jgi:catechol 2,3-dioxygenase-like lactoylglutathione lyase family enzyme
MLEDKDVSATIAVKDLGAAKRFYEGTLGLHPATEEGEGGVVYKSGRSAVLVYESEFAGSNKATAATWVVGDSLDRLVRDLRAKGVDFEHYDHLPETTRKGDVHVAGDLRIAWLKDPDGNILAMTSR